MPLLKYLSESQIYKEIWELYSFYHPPFTCYISPAIIVSACSSSLPTNRHLTSHPKQKQINWKAAICILVAVSGIATAVAHIGPQHIITNLIMMDWHTHNVSSHPLAVLINKIITPSKQLKNKSPVNRVRINGIQCTTGTWDTIFILAIYNALLYF